MTALTNGFTALMPELRSRAASLTRQDPTAAEDLISQTFLNAAKAWDSYNHNRPLRNWLYRIMKNLWLNERSSYRARRVVSLDGAMPGDDGEAPEHGAPARLEPDQLMVRTITQVEVRTALLRLDEPARTAVVLVYLHGMTYHEAAGRLGIRETVLRRTLTKARQQMAATVDQRYL